MADNATPAPSDDKTPQTPDIVQDNNAKEIRKLQDRLARAEKTNQDLTGELGGLRDIIKGLSTMPPKNPDPAQPRKSLLDEVTEFLFPAR